MSQLSIARLFPFHRDIVESTRVDGENHLRIVVRPDRRFKARCGACQSEGKRIWQHETRKVRDIPMGRVRSVQVTVKYRKVSCPQCGKIWVQDLDVWVEHA